MGFESIWGKITDLQNISFTNIWVDLNLGSNVVTSARPINYMLNDVNLDERLSNSPNIDTSLHKILYNSPFTCGHIQTEMNERSQRTVKYVELLSKHDIKFVLGTDAQGAELTSLFGEQSHFKNLMHWHYKNSQDAELMNKRLKSNTTEYIKYALMGLKR